MPLSAALPQALSMCSSGRCHKCHCQVGAVVSLGAHVPPKGPAPPGECCLTSYTVGPVRQNTLMFQENSDIWISFMWNAPIRTCWDILKWASFHIFSIKCQQKMFSKTISTKMPVDCQFVSCSPRSHFLSSKTVSPNPEHGGSCPPLPRAQSGFVFVFYNDERVHFTLSQNT